MQELPTGMQSFERIRKNNYLYIDKTEKLLQLAKTDKSYFLSRPRRFGKSLTVSTLEAMFKGKTDLFKGLYAEEWVKEQSKSPNPVIKLDMSTLKSYEGIDILNHYLVNKFKQYLTINRLTMDLDKNADIIFSNLIIKLYQEFGSVVVLIDEYDKPITDNINNLEKANEVRNYLCPFYSVLKDSSDYLRFVFITGISKFSKVGIFSGLNNLKDISMRKEQGDIAGYTQKELEDNFGEYLEIVSKELATDKDKLLTKIKKYYDGFKAHKIEDSEEYRHLKVSSDFTNASEIEQATPESFLFQSGYLTIEKWEDEDEIILDYPNEEIKKSLPKLYLNNIYNITDYIKLADEILVSLKNGDMINVMLIFNGILARIPYDDFANDAINKQTIETLNEEQKKIFEKIIYSKKEKWYRSLFIMLLSVVKVQFYPEVHDFQGRSDVVIPFDDKIIIIEFKLAPNSKDVPAKKKEGEEQIKKYIPAYENTNKKVITTVFVADDEKRQVIL